MRSITRGRSPVSSRTTRFSGQRGATPRDRTTTHEIERLVQVVVRTLQTPYALGSTTDLREKCRVQSCRRMRRNVSPIQVRHEHVEHDKIGAPASLVPARCFAQPRGQKVFSVGSLTLRHQPTECKVIVRQTQNGAASQQNTLTTRVRPWNRWQSARQQEALSTQSRRRRLFYHLTRQAH